MAKRPSVKEILEQARKGGAAKPADLAAAAPVPAEEAPVEEVAAEPAAEVEAAPEPAAPAADVPTPAKLGRPLTLKEKLAAARAGGATPPAAMAPAKKAAAPAAEAAAAAEEAAAEEAPAAAEPAKAVPAPAAPLGRPLTLKEKLAAARAGGGTAAPAPAAGAAPAKPAAKPAAAAAAKGAPRTLPPLEKMSDPRDLAEALRQTGAKKAKEVAAKTAEAAPAKAPAAKGGHKDAKPQTVPPKPSKQAALATSVATAERRGFMIGFLFFSFVALGWTAFAAASVAFMTMLTRFMFPNVLAEPPSTIKIGLPSNYEKEDVNERFKAEWGFWVVRSSRYNSNDILYAIKSVCTHLGCPPNWLAGEQKFKCPCHGSGFYISGINFEGPAPRPLERFKVSISDDGQIVVDKSQIFQQELGQWEDPDSFIKV